MDDSTARELAEQAMVSTLRAEFGRAEELLCNTHGLHPRLALEWAHLHLVRAVFAAAPDGLERASRCYLQAAALAEDDAPPPPSVDSKDSSALDPWALWARASAAEIADCAPPPRGGWARHPDPDGCWSPLWASRRAAAAARRAPDGTRDTLTGSTAGAPGLGGTSPDATAEWCHPVASCRTLSSAEDGEDASMSEGARSAGSDAAPIGSARTPSEESGASGEPPETLFGPPTAPGMAATAEFRTVRFWGSGEPMDAAAVSARSLRAEALTLAAALQMMSAEHSEAACNLRTAWGIFQPLREGVSIGALEGPAAEDVRVGVGVFFALVPEFPDGLRRVLSGVAPLVSSPEEDRWLIKVFAAGGKRAQHAGAALVWRQLSRPSVDAQLAKEEAQVLQALLLRHPQSVLLHLAVSLQRRRHGDACGALDAAAAARRTWEHPKGRGAGRPRLSALPPLLLLLSGDACFAALRYKHAAQYYRKLIDIAAITGEHLECQGRVCLRLAGVMTFMGLQRWPGQPWGTADEWLLRAVALARANRREEEEAACVAARFAHLSQLRPLLGYWQLFLMGDLEQLGSAQLAQVVKGLQELGRGNPGRPPAEDHLAYAEGQALHRLLLGAAICRGDPAAARELWRQALVDARLGDDSVAMAYTQLLMGELDTRQGDPDAQDRAARLLICGAELPGDRSTHLRIRYSEALRALPAEARLRYLPASGVTPAAAAPPPPLTTPLLAAIPAGQSAFP
eukprot:TRINITY_DN47251_c0_g1_i1.p1 TRINITY_DN47251_c0_g1~~TRINITY_DN47251_c0_g1_i1.p1  ORF type:complete len:766 (+),score=222.87 TRINITY_DN47251_c0_g1_i1:81-2300(+)